MKEISFRRRCAYGVICLFVAAVLLVIDQVTKSCISAWLKPEGTVSVINGLLEFTYLENTGAAFGLFKNLIWVVTAITIAVFFCLAVALFRYRNHTFFSYASMTLLMAGGIGNLIDRFSFGFVIDFIHVLFFGYIFNFADCCVTVGAVLLVLHVILITYREKKAQDTALEESSSGEDNVQ